MRQRKMVLAFYLAVAVVTAAFGQSGGQPDVGLRRLRMKLNPEHPAWSPEHVADRCAEHLATINESARERIRYFDFSDVPRDVHPSGVSATYFTANSASASTSVCVPRPVPNSDNRLFWIDLYWYGWSHAVWERITAEDPYFREPIIPSSSDGWRYLRQTTRSAGPVVKAGWLVYYTLDTTQFLGKQAGKNDVRADDAFYYLLTYGLVEKVVTAADGTKSKKLVSNAPQTAAQFEKFWKIRFDDLKDFPIDVGMMVDQGDSNVSYKNRILWRVQGSVATYWRTFDVFRSVGDQDFVETPFPKEFDAGEHIIRDGKGAQHYMLSNGKGARVEFGDPRVVTGAPAGHPAVITPMGCIQCHDNGIIRPKNEHKILRDIGVSIKGLGYERSERFRQFFLDNSEERKVKIDQDDYAEFVRACNGLTPQENASQVNKFRGWWAKPLTLEQCSRDVGCTPKELEEALALGVGTIEEPKGVTKGRLGRLVMDGKPVPREVWERGGFQEAALILIERRKRVKMPKY